MDLLQRQVLWFFLLDFSQIITVFPTISLILLSLEINQVILYASLQNSFFFLDHPSYMKHSFPSSGYSFSITSISNTLLLETTSYVSISLSHILASSITQPNKGPENFYCCAIILQFYNKNTHTRTHNTRKATCKIANENYPRVVY